MRFPIQVQHNQKMITLYAERVFEDDLNERYIVSGKNREIVVQNDRPQKRGRSGIKWDLVEGEMKDAVVLTSICFMIEEHIYS